MLGPGIKHTCSNFTKYVTNKCSLLLFLLINALVHLVEVGVDAVDISFIDGSPSWRFGPLAPDILWLIWVLNCLESSVYTLFDNSVINHLLDMGMQLMSMGNLLVKLSNLLLHGGHLVELLLHFDLLKFLLLLVSFNLSLASSTLGWWLICWNTMLVIR